MTGISLYEMTSAYVELLDAETEQENLLILRLLEGDIRAKSYNIVQVLRHLDRMAEAQSAEAAELSERARRNRAHAEWLKNYLKTNLIAAEMQDIDAGPYRLRVVVNPPAVQVDDASKLPSEFQRTKIEILVDKRAILEHHRTTGEIPEGVTITRSQGLRIS